MEKEYYSITEIAKKLSISRETVFQLIRRGRLEAFNVGSGQRKYYKISAKALDKFVLTNNKDGEITAS